MKKLLSVLLMCLMVVGLVACSSSETTTTEGQTEETKTILVATSPDYPPYENLENGEIVGFDADMVDWLFTWLKENGYNYDYEWKQMSFDTIISAIQTDQVDLGVAGFTYDEDRQVLFSDPYYDSAEVAIVTADSDITTSADLKDKKIGAQMGTTGETCANELTSDVTAIEDASILVETLKAGSIDAVVLDKAVADNYVATGNYKLVEGNLLDEENYIIAAEGNDELMEAVNKAIAAFKESEDFATLEAKWFGGASAE